MGLVPSWITTPDPSLRPQQWAWPTVDLGGTKTRVLMVTSSGAASQGDPQVKAKLSAPTPRGLDSILQQLLVLLTQASQQVAEQGIGTIPALAIGTPGRFVEHNGQRVLAPRTATNLEAFPGELDLVNLKAALAEALSLQPEHVFVDNDAVAQGLYLISKLLQESQTLQRHNVVCIHPGTGLGGCVAEVTAGGEVEVFTDSHISELSLHPCRHTAVLDGHRAELQTTPQGLQLCLDEHAQDLLSPAGKQAEDIVSGSGIAMQAQALDRAFAQLGKPQPFAQGCHHLLPEGGVIDGRLLSVLVSDGADAPPTAIQAARFIAEFAGTGLFCLTHILHTGTCSKTKGFPNWSSADQERLRGVTHFVFGGGISQQPLGNLLLSRARQLWADKGILVHFFEFEAITNQAGALGALSLVPLAKREQLESLSVNRK